MMTRDMSESLEPILQITYVWDHHHDVGWLSMLIKFMCNMSIFGVPGVQDSDWGHIGVPGAVVVGAGGPGPSP